MQSVVIYFASCIAALTFEWAFRVCGRRVKVQPSKAQYACFFWVSGLLLCGISLMMPYSSQVFVEWSPMFLVAFFHVLQTQQFDFSERASGKAGTSAGNKP